MFGFRKWEDGAVVDRDGEDREERFEGEDGELCCGPSTSRWRLPVGSEIDESGFDRRELGWTYIFAICS